MTVEAGQLRCPRGDGICMAYSCSPIARKEIAGFVMRMATAAFMATALRGLHGARPSKADATIATAVAPAPVRAPAPDPPR